MIGDNLFDYVKTIRSRRDFIQFLNYLNDDYRENNSEWENKDLQSFLAGLSGFSMDMTGYYCDLEEKVDVESISWRMVAEMLLAAKVYSN
jgi:hypothetical protein